MTEQQERDRLTREVQDAETKALTIRQDLERLIADPAKVTSRRRDAGKILGYRGELSVLSPPMFHNQETERAFDALLDGFKASLDTLMEGLTT